jgi:hypothetical protein
MMPFKILNIIVDNINILRLNIDIWIIDKSKRRLIITL